MSVSRHDVLALLVAIWALWRMAVQAALAPSPWLWVTWLSAAAFLVLLAPAVESRLRASLARRAGLAVAVPALVGAVGAVAAVGSGVAAWRIAVWGGAIALAVAVTARTAAEEVGPWRLLVLALVFGLLAGIWDRALKLPVPGGTRLGFSFLAAVVLAIFALRVVRPLATLDLRLAVSRGAHGTALGAVLALVAVAAPLGWLADYVAWNPRPGPAVAAVERFASLVVFVAIPEELLFRGLIQEALTRLRGPRVGLVGASLLFGLTHIGKATGLAPEQINALGLNWRYALLAAFAGLAYGWVYQRTGKIAAAALTHGAVNWIWSSFLLR